jgi:hypothetical protein
LTPSESQRIARDFATEVGKDGFAGVPVKRLEANMAAYVRKWVSRQERTASQHQKIDEK